MQTIFLFSFLGPVDIQFVLILGPVDIQFVLILGPVDIQFVLILGPVVRGKRFTVCTEITIIVQTVRFTIRGGRKRYDAHFLEKSSVELPISSFGDYLINIFYCQVVIFYY